MTHSVKDFLGCEWELSCMGCEIASGAMQVPGGILKQTHYFCVHQDPLIPLPGFLVIASTRHIRSIGEMQADEYVEFAQLVKSVHQAIKCGCGIEFLTIVQEEHSSHFHLWFFPWTEAVTEKYGRPALTAIRGIMADYRQQPISAEEWEKLQGAIEKIKALLA